MKKFLAIAIILTVCMSIFSFSLISEIDAASNQNIINLAIQPKDSTTVTLSTYASPILYKDQAKQPIIFALTDQDGNYVSGATFDVKYTDGTTASYTVAEISKGLYRFIIDTTGVTQHNIKFTAAVDADSGSINSNSVTIFLRDKDVFNPYVDVNAIYSINPYGTGPTDCGNGIARRVFDQLPCTIGNTFEVSVDYWQVTDPANWYVYNVETAIKGPVEKIGKNRYICNKAGKITASISMVVWERENTNCPSWDTQISEDEMSLNAEAHSYSKTFDICKNEDMPFLSKVSLKNGEQTDETTIEAGKSADIVLGLNEGKLPSTDLSTKIIHIYMTDGHNVLPYAFTINAKKASEIWYNPSKVAKTNITELPVTFKDTTSSLEAKDTITTLTFSDIQFNYPNCPDSGYYLVTQVFAEQRYYDSNGDIHITFPLINETLDNIQITPVVKMLNSTAVIEEGSAAPETILAGVNSTIDISNPHFTLGKPKWILTFNGKPVEGSVKETSTGYRAILKHSLNDAGKLEIFGYVYDTASNYSKKEQTAIKIPVVKPEFTLQLGLSDGTKIDNDGILTEGFFWRIYGTVTDPRGIHDFSSDWWTFKPEANHTSSGIPLTKVYYNTPGGANDRFPISTIGYTNPNLAEDPTFDLYFVVSDNTKIYITTFKLVSPMVTVDPKEVPFTIPATATNVNFTVTDAHGHGAPGIKVTILSPNNNKVVSDIVTGLGGKGLWTFVPQMSGLYTINISPEFSDEKNQPPCGWPENGSRATIKAVSQIPIDTEKPVITVIAPEDGATVDTDIVKIKGSVTDNVGVTELYLGSMKVDFSPDGTFSANCALSEGENVLKVFAFDAAGNKAEKDITVTYKPVRKTVIKVQIGSYTMAVNGTFEDLDVAPVIHEGHTYLPLRATAEALGAKVDWIAATKSITLTLGESSVGLQIGNSFAVVNGNNVKIYPPYLQPYGDGTYAATMVPLRVIAEGLGAEVSWDPDTRVVTISLIQP